MLEPADSIDVSGTWRLERGMVPGIEVGDVVAVSTDGNDFKISRPFVGLMLSMPVAGTTVSRLAEGSVGLKQMDGREIVLSRTDAPRQFWGSRERPETLVRTYPARSASLATKAFEEEARTLATNGFQPTSQSWAAADRIGYLIAQIAGLALGLWGILVLGGGTAAGITFGGVGVAVIVIAQAFSPSGGSLTVTYVVSLSVAGTTPAPPAGPPASGQQSVRERLADLEELHRDSVITDAEYAMQRGEILKQI